MDRHYPMTSNPRGMDPDPWPESARSPLAMGIGVVVSMLISGSLVIATAKAGISPGVSPLVVLVGWVLFGSMMRDRLKPFLAILQVTGSGGAAVSAGLIFTAPVLQIAADMMGQPVPDVDIATTMLSCVAGSLLGWGFVGLATKRFLTDPRLPAPEAVACDQLIQTAVSNPEDRPAVGLSLLPALVAGFAIHWLVFFAWIEEVVHSVSITISRWAPNHPLLLPVPLSPLFLGIGALLTFPTALLVFAGGLINALTKSVAAENLLPDETYRWVGGAAMVVAVVYSLINYLIESRKQTSTEPEAALDEALLEISAPLRAALYGAILVGAALLFLMLSRQGLPGQQILILGSVSVVLISLLSGLGGLLSLQVGASASPVSGTVFVAMLVLSLTSMALQQVGYAAIVALQPILVAACVAIAAANDSSQDYKTMQLNDYLVSSSFFGQLLGCLAGAVTVPISLWIAHRAFTLGSEALPCPQAKFFGTVLTSLFDPQQGIPWTAVQVGLGLGCIAVAVEIAGRAQGLILSSLAFAVGIYLPAEMGIGILMGNLARVVATRSFSKTSHRGILAAAGLIVGDAFFSLLVGLLIVVRVDVSPWKAANPWLPSIGLGILACVVSFLAFTYLDVKKRSVTEA